MTIRQIIDYLIYNMTWKKVPKVCIINYHWINLEWCFILVSKVNVEEINVNILFYDNWWFNECSIKAHF